MRWPSHVAIRFILCCTTAAFIAASVLATAPRLADSATTFTVTALLDSGDGTPGDGLCRISAMLPLCTPRAAIQEANALSGTDTIILDIGLPEGTYTYSPATPLPLITGAVNISKSVDGGQLILNGSAAGAGADGLAFTGFNGAASTIRDFAIVGFADDGIASGSVGYIHAYGMRIGIDYADTAVPNGGDGIDVNQTNAVVIGSALPADRNIISGNTGAGVRIAGASANFVQGNYIGLDSTGTLDRGNGGAGVDISLSSGNTIGGTTAGQGNVISGNGGNGVLLAGPNNDVLGNYIGTDYTGTLDRGNTLRGIHVSEVSSNDIGGSAAGARNIISGNDSDGVVIAGVGAIGTDVYGNYIGLDVTGILDLGNSGHGVYISLGSSTMIGGIVAGEGNVISGNGGSGVEITSATGNVTRGNFIGTDYTGELDRGNDYEGVTLTGGGSNTIGGSTSGVRNVISGNGAGGVFVSNSTNNIIRGNYIGTDDDGAQPLGNAASGIYAFQGSGLQVGGSIATERNVIAGNDDEVLVQTSSNVTIVGNYIGIDAAAMAAIGPMDFYTGVWLDGVTGSTIGGTNVGHRNRIANATYGVAIRNGDANSVLGNYIGAGPGGSSTANQVGVYVEDATVESVAHRIGNGAANGRNYISGNSASEVTLVGTAQKVVQGNYIGTIDGITATGTSLGTGVRVIGGAAVIGGATAGQGNVITSQANGILLANTLSSPVIQGNFIGTNAAGTGALANGNGIQIQGSGNLTIGGTGTGMGNVISGNGHGILVNNVNNSTATIAGNLIGVDSSGDLPLPNTNGIVMVPGISSYTMIIGGPDPGARNIIQHNTGWGVALANGNNTVDGNVITDNSSDGITVLTGANNLLTRNVIFDNGGLGIDLNDDGVTANDDDDPDTGPNLRQNYPGLASAVLTTTSLTIDGQLDTSPLATFTIEFFTSPGCDSSGYGEGAQYLGVIPAATNGLGIDSFSNPFMEDPLIPPGHTHVTATATDATGNTSEFSACVALTQHPDYDSDGVLNTNDNCDDIQNPLQEWSDRNFIDQTPPATQDDRTWPMSDPTGDACDTDDDNDGLLDVDEAAGCNTSGPLSPTNRDTDGDRVLDGAECALGTNPGNPLIKPSAAACAAFLGVGASVDTDGDRLFDRIEYCAYNTDRLLLDTDGDQDAFPLNANPTVNLIRDGCEAASLNNDRAVNSADQLLIALEIAREVDQTLRLVSMDINKDGGVNSGDQLLMVGFIVNAGSCP